MRPSVNTNLGMRAVMSVPAETLLAAMLVPAFHHDMSAVVWANRYRKMNRIPS